MNKSLVLAAVIAAAALAACGKKEEAPAPVVAPAPVAAPAPAAPAAPAEPESGVVVAPWVRTCGAYAPAGRVDATAAVIAPPIWGTWAEIVE